MISEIPVLRYFERFIKNRPLKGTNKNPIVSGVGTRKSIIVYLCESIFSSLFFFSTVLVIIYLIL